MCEPFVSPACCALSPDTDKDYQALVVEVELSDPLRSRTCYRQLGQSAVCALYQRRQTARYPGGRCGQLYGLHTAQTACGSGQFYSGAQSIYTQLVPSSQTGAPMAAALPYASANFPVQGTELVGFNTAQNWSTTSNLNLPGGCTRRARCASALAVTRWWTLAVS